MIASRLRLALAAIGVVVLGITSTGCTSYQPLVPESLVEEISADGREWTYDVAWQNTRYLTKLVDTSNWSELETHAIVLTARLHRLETARASQMADGRTARVLAEALRDATIRTTEANTNRLSTLAPAIEESFDRGDFAEAKKLALEVLVISRVLGHSQSGAN